MMSAQVETLRHNASYNIEYTKEQFNVVAGVLNSRRTHSAHPSEPPNTQRTSS
jgi:hypothetical protein